jgi:hypothetical protein
MDNEVQGEKTPPNLAQLTEIYIKIRDARAELKGKFDQEDLGLKEQMGLLETSMLDACKDMNADSVRTPHGTIIRSVKSRYWTNDWDSMYDFIEKHGAFGLLEKRLHQTNMKDFLAENPDILPMGLNVDSEYTVVVRRSKS